MMTILSAISIGTKTYFLCSSFKYSITTSCFNSVFVLLTFIWCLREMILLSTSCRTFIFQSANSSIVILGFFETIRSMLESKPVYISRYHLFQFIDIASLKLRPLLTSFLNLEFVIILTWTVKTWPCFLSKYLYVIDNHILLWMPVLHVVSSFVSMENTVSLWFKVHQLLIYRERDFLQYLNGVLNLGLCSRILYGKTPKSQMEDAFSVAFCLL